MSTPRTDKKAVSHIGFYSCATVPASLARELEIETQQLQAERDALRDACEMAAGGLNSLRRQCDEREWAEDWMNLPECLTRLKAALALSQPEKGKE